MSHASGGAGGLGRRLVAGGRWAAIGRVGSAGLYALLNIVLVRSLSPGDVGYFFMCFSVVTASALIAQAGVNHWIVKSLSESVARSGGRHVGAVFVRGLLVLATGIACVAAVLVLGVGEFLFVELFAAPELVAVLPVVVIWLAGSAIQSFLAEAFRGLQDFRMASLLAGAQSGGLVTLSVTLLLWLGIGVYTSNPMLQWFLIALVVAMLAVSVAAGLIMLRTLAGFRTRTAPAGADEEPAAGRTRIASAQTLPAFLAVTVATYIFQQSDLWVVAGSSSAEDLAVYASASRLTFLVALPLMMANAVVAPFIVELLEQGHRDRLEAVLRKAAGAALALALPVAIVFVFFGRPLLGLLFGAGYSAGSGILVVLTLGKLANTFAGSCGFVLLYSGYQRAAMMIGVATAGSCLIAAVLAARIFEGIGVAVVFSVALVLQNVLSVVVAYRALGLKTYAGGIRLRDAAALIGRSP